MLVLLNGAAGGWDELAIAVVALGVMWLAVKLAGRQRRGQDDDDEDAALAEQDVEEDQRKHPAHPPATPPD